MPDTLLMSDACLLALVIKGEHLDEEAKVREFLQPWLGVDKYTTEILACLQRSTSNGQIVSSKSARKLALQIAQASKKIKFMADLIVAMVAKIQELRDLAIDDKE